MLRAIPVVAIAFCSGVRSLDAHKPLKVFILARISNSAAVASLVLIWAMIEGVSVSVRGCDWPVGEGVADHFQGNFILEHGLIPKLSD